MMDEHTQAGGLMSCRRAETIVSCTHFLQRVYPLLQESVLCPQPLQDSKSGHQMKVNNPTGAFKR